MAFPLTNQTGETMNHPTEAFKRYGTNLRIFDNGGKTFDRYTIVPAKYDAQYKTGIYWDCIGSSNNPYDPQGFGQASVCQVGPHLGKRVSIDKLPSRVVQHAKQVFPEYFEA